MEFNGQNGKDKLEHISMPIVNQITHDALLEIDGGKWASGFGWQTEGDYWIDNDIENMAYDCPIVFSLFLRDLIRAKELVFLESNLERIQTDISKLTASPDVPQQSKGLNDDV
jgi:hypothetical protein